LAREAVKRKKPGHEVNSQLKVKVARPAKTGASAGRNRKRYHKKEVLIALPEAYEVTVRDMDFTAEFLRSEFQR